MRVTSGNGTGAGTHFARTRVAAIVSAATDHRARADCDHARGGQCAYRSREARQRRHPTEDREPSHSGESTTQCLAECTERHAGHE